MTVSILDVIRKFAGQNVAERVFACFGDVDGLPDRLGSDGGATNSMIWSNDQTNAAWIKVRSVVTQDQVGLDGLPNTACKLNDDSSTGTNNANVQTHGVTVTSGHANVAVSYAKKDQLDWIRITTPNFDVQQTADFDLTNGVVGTITGGGNAGIEDAGNGFYKCMLEFTSTTDLSGSIIFGIAEGDGDPIIDLDGTSSIILGNIEVYKSKTIYEVQGLPPIFTEGA